jgi:hypothetical protein
MRSMSIELDLNALDKILFSELFILQRELERAGLGPPLEHKILTHDRMKTFIQEVHKKLNNPEVWN